MLKIDIKYDLKINPSKTQVPPKPVNFIILSIIPRALLFIHVDRNPKQERKESYKGSECVSLVTS